MVLRGEAAEETLKEIANFNQLVCISFVIRLKHYFIFMLRKNSIPESQRYYGPSHGGKKIVPHQPSYYSQKPPNFPIPMTEQFEQVCAQTQSDIVLYKKRSESQIKGTPKVIILQRNNQKINVAVQNPHDLLLNWLRTQDHSVRIKAIQGVVNCFIELVWVYGHFYIDREMMKVTSNGEPVSWIHHNFKMNLRQFPIQTSKASESIFVRKLRSTLSQVLYFPSNVSTQTIFQLKELIKFVKNTPMRPSTSFFTPKTPTKQDSSKKQILPRQVAPKKIQINTPKISKSPPGFATLTMNRINSIDNIHRHKNTGNLEKYQHKYEVQTPTRFPKPSRLQTQYTNRSSNKKMPDSNPQTKQEERYVPSKSPMRTTAYKKKQAIVECESPEKEDNKNRKLSADYVLLQDWIKTSGKVKDRNFAGTSFSTRVTFSSNASKGQNEANPNQVDDCKDPKNKKLMVEVQTKDSFGNKQRLSANLKQFLRESGIRISRISQQGQIEMQFDNLFAAEDNNQLTERNPLKQSELKKELEYLFKSQCLDLSEVHENQQELVAELANILN